MAIDIQSDGESLKTTVSVKSGRKKLYENLAHVVEAFHEKYIKVDLVDEDDHFFKLNWNGKQYEGNFFGTTLICQYDVTRDFKVDIMPRPGQVDSVPVVSVNRSSGGRPNRYKE
mgnify:CR=1 FL=1